MSLAASVRRVLFRILFVSPAFRWTGKPLAKAIWICGPRDTFLLPRSPLFDPAFYAKENPDLNSTGNLWAHYLAFGADELRDPNPFFDTSQYLAVNRDVAAGGLNPLVHYLEHGAAEGRDPSSAFSTSWYLGQYSDVREQGLNPLLHYWVRGRVEGRQPAPLRYAPLTRSAPVCSDGPQIGVIIPTWNTPRVYLEQAIESVLRQTYRRWRLYIYDDASSEVETREVLDEYAERDNHIMVRLGTSRLGIAGASNAALSMAQVDYVAMLDHDDELAPNALAEVAHLLNSDESIDAVYTDQAYIDASGGSLEPLLKPDWSPELFRGVMYVGHLLVVRQSLAQRLGGFDSAYDRVQDFEFMLRLSEATRRIVHLPKVLYYWRRVPGSVAFRGDEKGPIEPLQAAAVNAHLQRCGIPATAEPHPSLAHRLTIRPKARSTRPLVKILLQEAEEATSADCLGSLLRITAYPNFVVVTPPAQSAATAFSDSRIRVHNGHAEDTDSSDYVVRLDMNLTALTPDWIEHLLLYSEQADVACAAPLIVESDGSVGDAGLVLGMGGAIDCPLRGFPADSDGYAGSLACARESAALSGGCLMMAAALWRESGAAWRYYRSSLYQGAHQSLDAFVKGRRNIVTPRARFRRCSRYGRPCEDKLDRALFQDRWRTAIAAGDPYYNSNFDPDRRGYCTRPVRPQIDECSVH